MGTRYWMNFCIGKQFLASTYKQHAPIMRCATTYCGAVRLLDTVHAAAILKCLLFKAQSTVVRIHGEPLADRKLFALPTRTCRCFRMGKEQHVDAPPRQTLHGARHPHLLIEDSA